MFLNVERYIGFLIKHRITPSQFLFVYLLRNEKYELIKAYKENFGVDGTSIGRSLIDDLLERKLIINHNTDDKLVLKNLKVSDELENMFIKDLNEITEQIFNEYPAFINISGAPIPLLTMDRYDFSQIYSKAIDNSIEEHKEVLEDIKFGKKYNLLKMKIETFVKSRFWLSLRKMRKEGVVNATVAVEEDLNNI